VSIHLNRDGLEHVHTSKGKKGSNPQITYTLTMSSTSQTWSPAIDTGTAGNGKQHTHKQNKQLNINNIINLHTNKHN